MKSTYVIILSVVLFLFIIISVVPIRITDNDCYRGIATNECKEEKTLRYYSNNE